MTPEEMRALAKEAADSILGMDTAGGSYAMGKATMDWLQAAEICERLDMIDSGIRDLIDMVYLTPQGVTVKPKHDPKVDH